MKGIALAVAALLLIAACSRQSAAPALQVVREFTDLDVASPLPAWSGTKIAFNDSQHRLTVANAAGTEPPRAVSRVQSFRELAWSPDGKSIVFTGPRPDTTTVYQQAVDGGEPVDLLPGAQATRGVSGAKFGFRWLDPNTLAFQEHMGSGVQAIRLVDVNTRQELPLPDRLEATFFTWAPDSARVAGQWSGPAPFWVYDLKASRFLKPAAPLPGESQWFEDWLDRDRCLFTAWTGRFPYQEGEFVAALYVWNVADGSVSKVADGAYLARGAGGLIAYVTGAAAPSLVVADAKGVLWQAELGGALPSAWHAWEFAPRINATHVLYRMASGEWRLSPLAERRPAVVHAARPPATAGFSPDGRYVAVLEQAEPPKLQILAVPFK
jgi:hypothetical protein